jgi:LysM domain
MAAPTTNVSTVAGHARRIFSQRAQAALLSVALLLGSTLPAGVAVAQEADQEREGVATPEPTTPPDSTADPDFDPGGDTALPFDLGIAAGGGDDDSGDGAPVDVEPVTDPDALAVPLEDPAAIAPAALDDGTDAPAPPAEPVSPPPPAAPVSAPPGATTAPQLTADQQTGDKRPAARAERRNARERQRDRARQRSSVRVTVPAPVTPVPAPVATTAAEPVHVAAVPSREGVRPGRSTYTVQPDDSLWKIASALVGAGATNGEIVAESNRIYRLNRDRIGADPDVLAVGTVLRLR